MKFLLSVLSVTYISYSRLLEGNVFLKFITVNLLKDVNMYSLIVFA